MGYGVVLVGAEAAAEWCQRRL